MSQDQRTIRLVISYDGTDFCGWQKQLSDRTIQGELEQCFSTMTTEKIRLHGAGRTDAGVHALGMVAHFNCTSQISCEVLLHGANSMLPGSIRVLHVKEEHAGFHARYAATGKKYHYALYTGKIQPPLSRLTSLHVPQALNLPLMTKCLSILTGTHDFSSFENSGSRDKSITTGRGAVRTLHSVILLQPAKNHVVLEITGDGFLKNMVRNLVGTILDVGKGKLTETGFAEILRAKDRTKAGQTAPAHGLTLIEVYYSR